MHMHKLNICATFREDGDKMLYIFVYFTSNANIQNGVICGGVIYGTACQKLLKSPVLSNLFVLRIVSRFFRDVINTSSELCFV